MSDGHVGVKVKGQRELVWFKRTKKSREKRETYGDEAGEEAADNQDDRQEKREERREDSGSRFLWLRERER